MRSAYFLLSFCLVLVGAHPAIASRAVTADDQIFWSNEGGEVSVFVRRLKQIRKSGKRVVINGPCISACTFVVGIVPRTRICAEPQAVLGFHLPSVKENGSFVPAPEAAGVIMQLYPADIRAWINVRGGLTTQIITLRGQELYRFISPCRS